MCSAAAVVLNLVAFCLEYVFSVRDFVFCDKAATPAHTANMSFILQVMISLSRERLPCKTGPPVTFHGEKAATDRCADIFAIVK
jgi:hypothetical protein